MRTGKKLVLCLGILLLCAQFSFGVDFGVTLKNTTGFELKDEAALIQKDKVSLWFDTALGENFSFTFQGSYTFNIDRYFLMDVDVLKFTGKLPTAAPIPASFNFALGRIPFREFSNMVLAHPVDGCIMQFGFPGLTASASAGYTGLSAKPNSSIVMSKTDTNNVKDDALFFSPPRLIEKVELRLFEVFLRQDIFISLLFQQDFWPAENFIEEGTTGYDRENGGKLDSNYYGIGFSGPIFAGFYAKGYGYLETGRTLSCIEDTYTYSPILSGLCGVEVNYFNKGLNNSNFGLQFVFSSGDEDYVDFYEGNSLESAALFIPISRPDVATAFSPQLGNLFFFNLHASVKPLSRIQSFIGQNFQVELGIIPMFRPTTGPISEPGLAGGSTSLYLGTEVDSNINLRISSDVGTSLEIGVFFPGIDTFSDPAPKFTGKFNLMVSI